MVEVNDVCLYSFSLDTKNKSQCIVKVKSILSEDIVEIEILCVIYDDSSNGIFTYLCNTKKPMNASVKYLKKLNPAEYNFLIEG